MKISEACHELSDEELAVRAANDKTAFSELTARYIYTIEYMAKRFLPDSGKEHAVKDLVQEGFMALVSAIKNYKPDNESTFSAYVGVCVRHRMISYLKKNSSSESQKDVSAEELEFLLGSDDNDIPENIIIEQERMNELYKKISSALSEREWQVFQLFLKDMQYKQIADELDMTVKMVNNTMQRVRHKLKSLLK